MSSETVEQIRARAMQHISVGELEQACDAFAEAAALEPHVADGWLHLATAERSMGRFHQAADHYQKAIGLLESNAAPDKGLLASALHALGATYEALDLTGSAVEAYRRAARADTRSPAPLSALSSLLARAGRLEEAGRAATEYCLAAVSILAEKGNIAQVRQFQKAMKQASSVDGAALLAATREAYLRGFEQTLSTLPPGVRVEWEPLRRDADGRPVPVLPNPTRTFARVRLDAIEPATGERWMIQDVPTYGFPEDCPAAAQGWFAVDWKTRTPFPVRIATRTAWDYFFVRLQFAQGLGPSTVERAEKHLGRWYERGFSGAYAEHGRGYFHFFSEPVAIGTVGLRYEVDLGLSTLDAVGGLFEALCELHALEPLALVVLGDGALPV